MTTCAPQPPSKDLLQLHNKIISKADKSKRQAGSPGAPSIASTGVTGVTTRSRWDDATVEECMAYIQQPHSTWQSAGRGMDISDVCPNWKKPRSEIASTVGDFSDISSMASGRPSMAGSVASSRRRQPKADESRDLDLTIGSTSTTTAKTPRSSQRVRGSINSGVAKRKPEQSGVADLGISGSPLVVAGTPSGIAGAARNSRPPSTGYSNRNRPSPSQRFTSSAHPRPAPHPGGLQ